MYEKIIHTATVIIAALALAAQLNLLESRHSIQTDPWPPAVQMEV